MTVHVWKIPKIDLKLNLQQLQLQLQQLYDGKMSQNAPHVHHFVCGVNRKHATFSLQRQQVPAAASLSQPLTFLGLHSHRRGCGCYKVTNAAHIHTHTHTAAAPRTTNFYIHMCRNEGSAYQRRRGRRSGERESWCPKISIQLHTKCSWCVHTLL